MKDDTRRGKKEYLRVREVESDHDKRRRWREAIASMISVTI